MPRNNEFRKKPLRPHHFPTLYFDADHVKPLTGTKMFNESITESWSRAAAGTRRLRHPIKSDPQDPVCMMLLVDALMKVEVHSKITTPQLLLMMEDLYPDMIWSTHNLAKLLKVLWENQEKSGAPRINGKYPIFRFMNVDYVHYVLIPDRRTYIWLGELRERLHQHVRHVVRNEFRNRIVLPSDPEFPKRVLWSPEALKDQSEIVRTPADYDLPKI